MTQDISFELNGRTWSGTVEDDDFALDFVRDRLGMTGTKRGCESQVCGACTILVDGDVMSSCTLLARELDGRRVGTVEGLASDTLGKRLQESFIDFVAAQCGFCTSGQLLSAYSAIAANTIGSPDELDEALSGNLCRCGCYVAVRSAVADVAFEGVQP